LKDGRPVDDPERQDAELVQALVSLESGHVTAVFPERYLPKPLAKIELHKVSGTGDFLKEGRNQWQGKFILAGDLV
jgi:hypothetical protein